MCAGYLGFVLLAWFPRVLHAQSAAQSCPALILKDGYVVPEKNLYSHDTKLTYACDNGYKPVVEGWWATSICQNGTWSHVPQCISEAACTPPTIPNAIYTENQIGWYENEHLIRIKCNEGYQHKDHNATARCENGEWSPLPICEISTRACGAPPKIPHASVVGQGYKEVFAADSEVQYECENGYTAEEADKTSIICISGTWTEGPVCNRETDPGTEQGGSAVEGGIGGQSTSAGKEKQPAVGGGGTGPGTEQGGSAVGGAGRGQPTSADRGTKPAVGGRGTGPGTEQGGSAVGGAGRGQPTSADRGTKPAVGGRGTGSGTEQGGSSVGGAGRGTGPGTGSSVGGAGRGQPTSAGSGIRDHTGSSGRSDERETRYTTIRTCGKPPVVRNGVVIGDFEEYLWYRCNKFYKLVGPETVTCYSDGTWSEVPICKATYCSVDTNTHPELKPTGTRFLKDGETVIFDCVKETWYADYYAEAECRDGRLQISRCCVWINIKTGFC